MHGEELKYITEAYETNWISTVGKNINEVEKIAAEKAGVNYAVGLSCCTAALHLCCKLAGERLYGKPAISHGALEGKRVFCSDMTFDATLNPVVYEGGMDMDFLERFAASPQYKVLLCHHPEYYQQLQSYPMDLILSGHCHGGQMRVCGRGIFAPGQGLFPKYHHGVYDGRLVVSSGCSNTARIPRWGNETEVVILRII